MRRNKVEEELIAMACAEMGCPVSDFFSRRRANRIAFTRFAVMDVLHRSGLWTATEAAEAVGRDEHTICLYAKKRSAAIRKEDGSYNKMIKEMEDTVVELMGADIDAPIAARPSIWKSKDEREMAVKAAMRMNPKISQDMAQARTAAMARKRAGMLM